MSDRFSLCCGVCNQPLELFETDDRLWGLACPEVLSPYLCRRLDHSIYRTFIPVWLQKPDFSSIMYGGLLALHMSG